jgi:hypothetical protein
MGRGTHAAICTAISSYELSALPPPLEIVETLVELAYIEAWLTAPATSIGANLGATPAQQ